MHGPDGHDYINKIEVEKPARLIYRHPGEADYEPVKIQGTVLFDERDGKTSVSLRLLFETAAERKRVGDEYGVVEGADNTLERLDAYLRKNI